MVKKEPIFTLSLGNSIRKGLIAETNRRSRHLNRRVSMAEVVREALQNSFKKNKKDS